MDLTLRNGTVAPPRGGWARAALAHAVLVRGAARAAAPLVPRLARPTVARLERAWAAAIRRSLGIRLGVAGLERIDPAERYVVTSLHESVLDPVVLAALPLPLTWVLRDEVAAWPDIGPYLRRSPHAVLRPEDGPAAARALLRAGRGAAAAGASLGIFPQGTVLGIETRFARGAAVAAARLGRPLLPVVLTGSHRVWEHPFTARMRFGQRVGIRVLPPVPASRVLAEFPAVESEMKRVAVSGALPPPRRFVPERDGWWDGYRYEIDPAFPALAAAVAAHRRDAAA